MQVHRRLIGVKHKMRCTCVCGVCAVCGVRCVGVECVGVCGVQCVGVLVSCVKCEGSRVSLQCVALNLLLSSSASTLIQQVVAQRPLSDRCPSTPIYPKIRNL